MQYPANRLVVVDAYRGIVMALLVPDLNGGFSLYRLSEQLRSTPLWSFLSREFAHAPWTGCTLWDLIQPSFYLVIGIAMPLSLTSRLQRGDSRLQIFAHVLLRAAILFVLAFMLRIPARTPLHELAPLALLFAGLPLSDTIARRFGIESPHTRRQIELWWALGLLSAAVIWLYVNAEAIGNYHFNHVFSQIALASVFAFALVGRPRAVQLGVSLTILVGYWLLFALYPLPVPGFDRTLVGVHPGDEVFGGFFAHWNKNTNVAAAFDVWFLNLLPRSETFLFDRNGLATLNFVPSIVTMVYGVMAGELMRSDRPRAQIRNTLFVAGLVSLVAGLLAGVTLCPIVKSIWTPSWVLFSGGICLLILTALYQLCEVKEIRTWATPFVIVGTNAILLYTLAAYNRWRFALLPQKLTGVDFYSGAYGPVYEALVVGALLWLVAYGLRRAGIFFRI